MSEGDAAVSSRSVELLFWLFTCAILAALPLAPALLLAVTVGHPQLDRESLASNGELLWSAAGVTATAILRVVIDGKGNRFLRAAVIMLSVLVLAAALIEVSEVRQAIEQREILDDVFEVSAGIYGVALIVSFFPMVWWVR